MACIICQNFISANETKTVLTNKGCETINSISLMSSENLIAKVGDKVHESCRKEYVSKNHVNSRLNSNNHTSSDIKEFSFDSCCIFCGEIAKINKKKKDSDVFAVKSKNFLQSLKAVLKTRKQDEWTDEVSVRISSVIDLVGSGAIFHKNCRIGFRTNKSKPKPKLKPTSKNKKISLPVTVSYKEGFLEIVDKIQKKNRMQYSIMELIDEMNGFSNGNAYSFNQMKANLIKYFGDNIIISTIKNKKSLVTLRETSYAILDSFYESTQHHNDKNQVIRIASTFILEDIKKVAHNKDFYPTPTDISLSETQKYLPESLQLLLSNIITSKKSALKISSIGQAIIQTAHRENVILPLQIGAAIQQYHVTGKKFVVNTLHRLGFSSTYTEVKKFQLCAIIDLHKKQLEPPQQEIPIIKYVADNVDHNLRTIDGKNTFHGMGIISIHEQQLTEESSKIPRIKATLEDVKGIATVDIISYFQKMTQPSDLLYGKLNPNQIQDPYSALDSLWKISWSIIKTRPAWSGMMQFVHRGSYPKKAKVNFLPIINMNPTDLTCIFSTLHFISKDADKFNAAPILTFDQPLYWKARTIIQNEPDSSRLKRVVLCLGGFHLKMSFLGSIGHIMTGSGLDVALAQVYAENSVIHMLSGKAYARAIRGNFMVDSALNSIIFDEILDEELSQKVGDLYKSVMDGSESIENLQDNEALKKVLLKWSYHTDKMKNDSTSRLWLQYMHMIDILKSNIRGDRIGHFQLHLNSIENMLLFFAASGRNMYTKSAYFYIQDMRKLEKDNPLIYQYFENGNFITRRTDRCWGGLPDDLIIEQLLMRSLKTSGGPTRGRGMDEAKLLLWLGSLPARAEMNNAIQDLTNLKTETSEQHKEFGKTRIGRDNRDIKCLYDFLKERNPFVGNTPNALINIADGVVSSSKSNADQAEEIGLKTLKSLEGKNPFEFSFKKCNQVVLMSSRNDILIGDEMVNIDPETLFQRFLILETNRTEEETETMFCYELCHRSPSLFDSVGLMRQAKLLPFTKALAKRFDCIVDYNAEFDKLGNILYVIEGDWMIEQIQWQKGESFDEIDERYVKFLKLKYINATIVFDCNDNPSTTDECWLRKTKGVRGTDIIFDSEMKLTIKKEVFLANKKNKNRFIELLTKKLQDNGFTVYLISNNLAVTIAHLAVSYSRTHSTVLVGSCVDLLIVTNFYAETDNCLIFYNYVEASKKPEVTFNITEMKSKIGGIKSKYLLFAHAMGGCKTTSQLFGIGKGTLLTKLNNYSKQAEVFCSPNSTVDEIVEAGNETIISLYKGGTKCTLNKLRYIKFKEKVARANSSVACKTLPPTEAAAKFHYLRVYYQIQEWMGETLNPLNFGWIQKNYILQPISINIAPAPPNILILIRCGCKENCDSLRCTCFKEGLKCNSACKVCSGNSCSNKDNTRDKNVDVDGIDVDTDWW